MFYYGEVNQLYSLFLSCGMAVFTFTLTLENSTFENILHSKIATNIPLFFLAA